MARLWGGDQGDCRIIGHSRIHELILTPQGIAIGHMHDGKLWVAFRQRLQSGQGLCRLALGIYRLGAADFGGIVGWAFGWYAGKSFSRQSMLIQLL